MQQWVDDDLLMCWEYPQEVKSHPHAWIHVALMTMGKPGQSWGGRGQSIEPHCQGRTLNSFWLVQCESNIKRGIPAPQVLVPILIAIKSHFATLSPNGSTHTHHIQQMRSKDNTQGPSDKNIFHSQSPSTSASGRTVWCSSINTTSPNPGC